ncbi:MAG: crosslink repair DNA glycosylase YcaQ family protein [Betaproteobacteria bacterium]
MPRPNPITLDALRRYAVARTMFAPTTLQKAIERLGFVQADPIRAPARAQDLTLRHRVKGYVAGDLERRYPRLDVEEDCLVNYGFVPRSLLPLLHPRVARRAWDPATQARAAEVLAFVRARGATHPRDVQEVFDHGRVQSWGATNTLNASTALLDGMHYRGLLRVARRDAGTRVYAAIDHAPADDDPAARHARARALLMRIVDKYAPLPSASLGYLAQLLQYGAPHLKGETRTLLAELRAALPQARIDGVTWLWTPGEDPAAGKWRVDPERARLLAPFDPVVWDRRRFELLWGWAYKFEAYTPAAKRTMGHYALPLMLGDRVVGWGNATLVDKARLEVHLGFVDKASARDRVLADAIDAELGLMAEFLLLDNSAAVRLKRPRK